MSNLSIIIRIVNGIFYEAGTAFTKAKWAHMIAVYLEELSLNGQCVTYQLADKVMISQTSTCKVVDFYEIGLIDSPSSKQGYGYSNVGILIGFQMKYHAYIYELYLANPSRPIYGYIKDLYRRFGFNISRGTMQSWFRTIGPFKATMWVTSKYPSRWNMYVTYRLLKHYLAFILSICDHTRLVFTDKNNEGDRCIWLHA